jgi:hypothetical protein
MGLATIKAVVGERSRTTAPLELASLRVNATTASRGVSALEIACDLPESLKFWHGVMSRFQMARIAGQSIFLTLEFL